MSQLIENVHDGVIITRRHWEGSKLVTTQIQDTDPIFNENVEIRKNAGSLRKLQAMQWELQIPILDLAMLKKANPDLTSPDNEVQTKAWKKFIASDESIPYRVRDHKSKISYG